jgi:diguanylate cyclase (GGDEF)-like protein/PAS domain S-box-containing protein
MVDRLRVLMLEDRPSDSDRVADALRQSGLEFDWKRVDRRQDYLAALADKPDVVLASYNVPGFGALEALDATLEQGSDAPVIVVTGSLGDEIAAECIKRGAADYLVKDRLARLGAAVEKEIGRRRLREAARQAARALRESETKFRELIEQASDGIFVTDEQGNFHVANPKYCEMLGYDESELRRLNVAVTFPEEERAAFPESVAKLQETGRRLLERTMRRKDGTRFPAEVSMRILSNGTHQGIVRDITERKRAERAVRASELRYRRLFEAAKDGILILDADTGQIVDANPFLLELLGIAREDLIDRKLWEIGLLKDVAASQAAFKELQEKDYIRYESLPLESQDGRRIEVEFISNAYAVGGTRVIQCNIRDITERKQGEARIRSLNRVYAMLSGINALIVRAQDRDDLFRGACRIAVEAGQFRMAWIGLVDDAAKLIRPAASAGAVSDFFEQAPLAMGQRLDSSEGLAPRAVRQREPIVSGDIQNDPRSIMREACRERGIHSVAFLPLLMKGEAVGVLGLYAGEPWFFDEEEMKLLLELAGDISFALEHIDKTNRLDYLAYYDALTGIANRKLLIERLDQRIRAAAEKGDKLALAILDIERFKNLNDTLGRQAGDQLLKVLADRFVKFLDNPNRVGRVLGDQFGVIIPDVRNEDDAARRVDRKLKECVGVPVRLGDSELRISARAGIALYPDDGADADTLFRNAEAALKRAKEGGERCLFYTQQMTERVGENLALENKLRQALEREEFVLHYQPKVDTATRRIESVEALIRWQSSEFGLVPPMHFIPLLEETGLILEVGAWALRRAALDYLRWSEQGLNAPRIAVNVSAIQLRRRDFVGTTLGRVRNNGGQAAIDLEVTESLIMENVEANIEKFEALRLAGMEIAIDDFGTGYSSLGYLAKLPVQVLKIDRSFIIAMLEDPAIMTLVSTIVSLAHTLKLKVVAEGVETEDQASALKGLGCDQLQGYLLNKPMAFDEITPLLQKREGGAA